MDTSKVPRVVWFTGRAGARLPYLDIQASVPGAVSLLRPTRGEGLVTFDDVTATPWLAGPFTCAEARPGHRRVELLGCDGGTSYEWLHEIFDALLPTEREDWWMTADPAVIARASEILGTTWTAQGDGPARCDPRSAT